MRPHTTRPLLQARRHRGQMFNGSILVHPNVTLNWLCHSRCLSWNLADLPAGLQVTASHGARLVAPHPLDGVCAVKRYVSDQNIAHPPVLVLPHGRFARLQSPLPVGVRPRNPAKHARKWLDLAKELVSVLRNQSAKRTALYLLSLAKGDRGLDPPPPLPFHTEGRPANGLQVLLEAPSVLKTALPVAAFRANLRR